MLFGPMAPLGAMGPKSMQRGARWAQGTYAFSMNGEGSEIRPMLEMADKAWEAEGRADRPYRMAGFWCSLADNAAPRLRQYVFDYLKIMGDDAAHAVSSMMTRSSVAAIRESIDSYSQLGVDEIMFVPATADLAEIDRLADLLARL